MTEVHVSAGMPNRFSSGWKGNVVIISLLILIMAGYYYRQLHAAECTFAAHVKEHARMVADVIRLNAERALLSQEIIEQIMKTFLGNAARFVDYLDRIEPFTDEELAAFASESGLSGIRIVRKDGTAQGPAGWLPPAAEACSSVRLRHNPGAGRYLLTLPSSNDEGCIQLGFPDARIREMRERVGLETLLVYLRSLGGILYIRIEPPEKSDAESPELILTEDAAEVRMRLDRKQLVVGMEARHYFQRRALLKQEFFIFTGVLLSLGLLFSWLLFRYQSAFLNQARQYERKLAREQEDAALGRASATITHEIRNPLNAISMGLQRLQLEADELADDHRNLIKTLLEAVGRTDGIIRELKRYSRPVLPRPAPVSLPEILDKILTLYRAPMDGAGIVPVLHTDDPGTVQADPDLISEVFENLIKNAVEAQPDGGMISIRLNRSGRYAHLMMENDGYQGGPDEIHQMTEPYVTTKTRGSGLGLAIVSRIVQAHDGSIRLASPDPGRFRVSVLLPADGPEHLPPENRDKGSDL